MTPIEPWHRIATPRAEVREGRSFNPDEFAIALEQVVAGTAPADYLDPAEFLARTYAISRRRSAALPRVPNSANQPTPILPAPPPSLRCSRPPRSPSLSLWMRS